MGPGSRLGSQSGAKSTPGGNISNRKNLPGMACSNAYMYAPRMGRGVTVPLTRHKPNGRNDTATRWGIQHEKAAREWINTHTSLRAEVAGKKYQRRGVVCRPDGLLYDPSLPEMRPCLLEIKCPMAVKNVRCMERCVNRLGWLTANEGPDRIATTNLKQLPPYGPLAPGRRPWPAYVSACGQWRLDGKYVQAHKFWHQLQAGMFATRLDVAVLCVWGTKDALLVYFHKDPSWERTMPLLPAAPHEADDAAAKYGYENEEDGSQRSKPCGQKLCVLSSKKRKQDRKRDGQMEAKQQEEETLTGWPTQIEGILIHAARTPAAATTAVTTTTTTTGYAAAVVGRTPNGRTLARRGRGRGRGGSSVGQHTFRATRLGGASPVQCATEEQEEEETEVVDEKGRQERRLVVLVGQTSEWTERITRPCGSGKL